MVQIIEEKEEIKMRRRKICPILSLNSPQGEVECLRENCEWYDVFDGECAIRNLKWIAKSLEAIGEIIERESASLYSHLRGE
ncbi:hypothetical protein [Candidatus Methanodesulfokora washburnensis]|jgi:hypothetical protein|uniref:Uncharacterized protein n=1 Tax=Candidatus Methanodesulfokora washburnensis TaxID=2478471 RepID=A0A3R9WZS2_9CREN|nr:hypothetical protein [Candidatus Methanodesulfokores washburnensis]RSN71261.1 hypothetical protein D6D85_16280 [Candidatus Methanodesulfokores washburnensis]